MTYDRYIALQQKLQTKLSKLQSFVTHNFKNLLAAKQFF